MLDFWNGIETGAGADRQFDSEVDFWMNMHNEWVELNRHFHSKKSGARYDRFRTLYFDEAKRIALNRDEWSTLRAKIIALEKKHI
jgi:plasmid maintenance system antidote protein VapI